MTMPSTANPEAEVALDQLCVNTIRFLAVDAVQRANSGHPGTAMALAPVAYRLFTRHLRHNPANPGWPDRDRFVLSAGHASMLLYALLHLTGYGLSLDDLRSFRQWGSRTPGHPERGLVPGVEVTTGPLGQGFAHGVGMALAEAHLAARFNRPGLPLVNHHTYAICSDGDLMEGVSHEAASLAGHLGLGKLIYLYDDNHITIEGATELALSDDAAQRFTAYGWQVLHVLDANDLDQVDLALAEAHAEHERPTLIIVRSHIGFGSPNRVDTREAHGEPLGAAEVLLTKRNLGWPETPDFLVPEEAISVFRQCLTRGAEYESAWESVRARHAESEPALAREYQRSLDQELPRDWAVSLPSFAPTEELATRQAFNRVLNASLDAAPWLVGGSADLGGNTGTQMPDSIERDTPGGRNVHFGVREHAMAAAAGGMTLHGGVRGIAGTFFIFSDYLRPSLRLSALMRCPTIFVLSHDSIGLGEDGPTHQPVEHLASLRAMPHLLVLRPADATEVAALWEFTLEYRRGPVAMVLSRQKLPVLDRERLAPAALAARGGYVLSENRGPLSVILIATGSEVHPALAAQGLLEARSIGARVVSLPSWELFRAQSAEYRESVLPTEVASRVSIEAASPFGWTEFTGAGGVSVGIDGRFGASAPAGDNMAHFGFTGEHIARVAATLVSDGRSAAQELIRRSIPEEE
ncbi:MAG: transketolase [Candidatus Dormibacteria bacterium]